MEALTATALQLWIGQDAPPIGALTAFNKKSHSSSSFDETDVKVLESLAHQLALALDDQQAGPAIIIT